MNAVVPRAELPEDYRHFIFYHYEPSMPAAIVFVVLFATATILHTYQLIQSRTWFMILFVVGGIFETVGYIGRTLSAAENQGPYNKIPYIIQSLLLLVAPPLFAASIYMELGRIVLMVEGESKLFIRRTWLTKMFVVGDCRLFPGPSIWLGYAGFPGRAEDQNRQLRCHRRLFLQIAFFGLFIVAATIFHFRLARDPTSMSLERPWIKHMAGLYVVSVLILARSIVRGVEFIQGYEGYIITHEIFLYVFDAVPMFLAVVTMNVAHPGEVATYARQTKDGNEKGSYRKVGEESADV